MILQLGEFQFESDMSYEQLQRETAWQWEEIPILGEFPVLQFSNPKAPMLNINGTWWNYSRNQNRLLDIEVVANEKRPLFLVDDSGNGYGFWVIEKLSAQGSIFRYGQAAPIKNMWTLQLKYYGETG